MKKSPIILLVLLIMLSSCGKDEESIGYLEGIVTDKVQGNPIAEARIIVFDANTNAPVGDSYLTDNSGEYSIELEEGTYFLKLYKLGYKSIPAAGVSPLPITVIAGENVITNFEMSVSGITDGGLISGKVESGDNAVAGVLVVAENGNDAFSSVSDGEGNYYIYNIIPGTYSLKGWKAGYNSSEQNFTLAAKEEKSDINLDLTNDATAGISGAITFLSTENIEVDISFVHPLTKETVPGLSTFTTAYNYLITNVPDGTYLARASYANDQKVIDPDWIVKNGEPYITIAGADETLNFSVTGAVTLLHPTNDTGSVFPVEIPADSAVFRWNPYPSASDYVIELSDASGNIVWGGFSEDWSTKQMVIPGGTTEVEFNFDGNAAESLQPGTVYRWKVYVSKDDKQATSGWRLISSSEDQMGLFRIKE